MKPAYKNLGKVRPTVDNNNWSINNEYDLLTIVYDSSSNKSYISRKDVPANIVIDNREYWLPFGVGKFIDNAIININYLDGISQELVTYTLEEAISHISNEDKRLGVIISFYGNESSDSHTPGWCLYQFMSDDLNDWDNVNAWNSIYYNRNKNVGWFRTESELLAIYPFPHKGDYCYIGTSLISSLIYRCYVNGTWTNTQELASVNIGITIGGNISISENGTWVVDNEDTGIKAVGTGINEMTYNPSQEDGGTNILQIKLTDGTQFSFSIKNGNRGNSGIIVPDLETFLAELVNDVVTDDATKALSAAQGVVLDNKISQLGQYIVPSINGDVLNLVKFVNGILLVGWTEPVYGNPTRLLSGFIRCNYSSSGTKIQIGSISNNLRFYIFGMKIADDMAADAVGSGWMTNRIVTLDLSSINYSGYYVMVSFIDDSNISPSDIDNFTIKVIQGETEFHSGENVKNIDITDKIEQGNNGLVKSVSVRESERTLNGYILPQVNGDILNILNFTTGALITGNQNVQYSGGVGSRLVCDKIIANQTDSTITIENNSSSPLLKVLVSARNKSTGVIENLKYWFTTGSYSFKIDSALYEYYCICIARNDDTNLTAEDINGITIISSGPSYKKESTIITLNNEDTTLVKLQNLNKRYIDYGESETEYPDVLTLLHFSDLHNENENLLRIKQFRDYYSEHIDAVIQTGDIADFPLGMPSAYIQTQDFLGVIGNHEATAYEGGSWIPKTPIEYYNRFFAPYISGWNVIQPANASENGYCYYYKDYTAKKVRLIVIDCMNYDATQAIWFTEVLEDARINGLHVLAAVHIPPYKITQDTASNPFTWIDSIPVWNGNSEAAAVQTFITNGGNFIGWICGHIHSDSSGTLEDYNKQFIFSIACAGLAPARTGYCQMARVEGTKSQDCFNVIGIDTAKKRIKIMRIGADYDRNMRHRNTMCWDYENSRLLYAD